MGLSAFTASSASAFACGDGDLHALHEECDDGNLVAGDGCDLDCHIERCGNGFVQVGEDCDPGTGASADPNDYGAADFEVETCDIDCTDVVCGDGNTNAAAGEDCDATEDTLTCNGPGATDTSDPNAPTSVECLFAACADGYTHTLSGEACDDGGVSDGDGCRGDCAGLELCGDGLTDSVEFCDPNTGHAGGADPNAGTTGVANADIAGCDDDCTSDFCRDGHTNSVSEECDDDNATDGDDCSNACTLNICGNGRVDNPENCDATTDPNIPGSN